MTDMRAKLRITAVTKNEDSSEMLYFTAVSASQYPADGSDENNSFAKWTPSAHFTMHISNPALYGKFVPGEEYYADFTRASV